MPPIPPAQLVPGRHYTHIQRAQPGYRNGRGTSRRFIQLNAQSGWPTFNAGHGTTGLTNPALFNFYNIHDPMAGIVQGANRLTGANSGTGAQANANKSANAKQGGKRKDKSRKTKRRMMKKRKTLRRK